MAVAFSAPDTTKRYNKCMNAVAFPPFHNQISEQCAPAEFKLHQPPKAEIQLNQCENYVLRLNHLLVFCAG